MAGHNCPERDQLSAFAFGTLDEALARELAEHVEQCPICDQTMQSLDREGDTVVGQLRQPAEKDPYLAESTFLQRLSVVENFSGDPAVLVTTPAGALPAPVPELPQLREYRLLAKLGEGGMGAVYKALHTRLDKIVAVKVLPSDRLKDPATIARFEREMKAIGRLEHPNVIRAHDAGEANGVHFLVMEYLDGADLSQVARATGPLPVADACELVRQAAVGLEYAHQQGLVHRDIKPSNLMLTTEGQVKVLDLGLARLNNQDVSPGAELTSTGQMMGTFDYMAPEQGSDTHHVDIRADIYSLGATLYKLLCGEAPFGGPSFNTPMKKMMALATQEPPPLSERRPDLPPPLAALIQRMLAKSPADRPATPRDVAAALSPLTTGHDLPSLAARALGKPLVVITPNRPLQKTEPYVSSGEGDTLPRLTTAMKTAPRPPHRRRVIVGIAAVLACLLTAFTIYHIQTAEGTIEVVLEGTDIEAKLKDGGVQIVDLKKGKPYTIKPAASGRLPSGKYSVKAIDEGLKLRVEDEEGLEVTTSEFVLRRNGKLIVRVTLAPTPDAPAGVAKSNAPSDQDEPGAVERRAIQWAFSEGATLIYMEKASKRRLKVSGPEGALPGEDYTLVGITLTPKTVDADLERFRTIGSLTSLFLGGCRKITDAGLERIGDMGFLERLELADTNVTDAGLESLAGLPRLYYLGLERTRITDGGIEILSRSCPGLTLLRTIDTGVTNIKPFLALSRLSTLDVSAFKDRQDYARLAELPELAGLRIAGRRLDNETLKSFPKLPRLQTLLLQDCEVDGPGLRDLAVFPELQWLSLSGCRLTDQGLVHLQGGVKLTELNLHRMPLSDEGLVHLYGMSRLKRLNVSYCKFTAAGIARLQESLPGCVITLDGVTQPTRKAAGTANTDAANAERVALEWAFRKGATLSYTEKTSKRTLQVRGPDGKLPGDDCELWSVTMPPDTTDADLDNVGKLRSLNTLVLYQCTKITDAGLQRLQDMSNLNQIVLTGTSISDAGLESLSGLSALVQLILERTRITNKGIEILSRTAPGLIVLRTVDTEVTGIEPFLSLRRLGILDVSGFKDSQDYARLAELPGLTSLKLAGRSVTDETLKLFPPLPRLGTLLFQDCDIGGPGLRDLAVLPGLRMLVLIGCGLTDESLVHLQGTPELTALSLHRMPLSDKCLVHLGELKKLTKLDLRSCSVTPAGVVRLQEALPGCAVTLDGKLQVASPKPRPTESSAGDPDRRAAEWVLSLGGMLQVAVPDKSLPMVMNRASLPASAFKIRLVSLNNPSAKTDDAGLANLAGLDEIETLNLTLAGPFTIAGMRHLAGLTSLKTLVIWSAPLTDAGFAPLLELRNLETLTIYDVQFTDAGLPQLAGLKSLRQLYLGDNPKITDDGTAALAKLRRLESLNLYKLRISDVGLERLLALPRLTALQLNDVDVTEAGLALIGSRTKLLSLNLDRLPVTDAGLKLLESLKSLNSLFLNDTEVTLDGAAALQQALPECSIHWNETKLTWMAGSPDRRAAVWVVSRGGMVAMSGTGTDEIEVKTLDDLPSVQSGSKVWKIFLQNARLRMSDHDLLRLTPLKELASLDLVGAGRFSPFAMHSLSGFKDLKLLRLADSSIGDEGLAHLQGLTKLEHLAVSNSKITNAGLSHLAGMKQLATLNIGGNDITDEGTATLAAFLELENLDLTHTNITDQGLERLLKLPKVTQLSIGRTRITEAGVKSLGAKPQLTRLALQSLPVADATLAALEPLGNLEVLDLKETRVTAVGIERLQKALPKCKIDWSAPN